MNQNNLGWKTPLTPASPTVNPALRGPPVKPCPYQFFPYISFKLQEMILIISYQI